MASIKPHLIIAVTETTRVRVTVLRKARSTAVAVWRGGGQWPRQVYMVDHPAPVSKGYRWETHQDARTRHAGFRPELAMPYHGGPQPGDLYAGIRTRLYHPQATLNGYPVAPLRDPDHD